MIGFATAIDILLFLILIIFSHFSRILSDVNIITSSNTSLLSYFWLRFTLNFLCRFFKYTWKINGEQKYMRFSISFKDRQNYRRNIHLTSRDDQLEFAREFEYSNSGINFKILKEWGSRLDTSQLNTSHSDGIYLITSHSQQPVLKLVSD